MSNEELNTMIMKAEDNYEALKDRVHEQFEEIKRLKEELKQAKEIALNEHKYASEIEDKYITANNIINEFESWLISWIENEQYCFMANNPKDRCRREIYEEALHHFKELKGSESNE